MADKKHFSLRWDQHASNLASEAECFYQDEAFLDCSLCAEGQILQAHRLILSAASPYLATLLRVAGDKQPILIFNDMQFEVLKAIVSFIYNGRVDVPENVVHPFLQAAQTLLLRGLTQVSSTIKPSLPPPKAPRRVGIKRPTEATPRLQEVPPLRLTTPHQAPSEDQFVIRNWRMMGQSADSNGKRQSPDYLFKKFRLEKPAPAAEEQSEPPPAPVVIKQEIDVDKIEMEGEEEEDTNRPDMSEVSPGICADVPVPLLVCKTSLQEDEAGWSQDQSQSSDLEELPCPTCYKKYKSRYALNRHVLYECGKARKSFSCDECGKKVTRQDTLQKHKLIHLVQHMKDKETAGLTPNSDL